MKRIIRFALVILVLGLVVAAVAKRQGQKETALSSQNVSNDAATTASAGGSILIGVEYAMPGMATAFAELGIPAVKQYPDAIRWEAMQTSPDAPIDFTLTDRFVREYQEAGFTTPVIALKSHSRWASVRFLDNPTPKPEHRERYAAWVRAIVERYDGDGTDDMQGLRSLVRYYEVGTEFSSYEPEPVGEYLTMLELAYRSAHEAYSDVLIAHAAFLTTTVFQNNPEPSGYEKAFAGVSERIMEHSLADIRQVLDRPDLFDLVNIHSLGEPYELEANVRWLRYEMDQREYEKPIIVSDTGVSPFAGYGPATTCKGIPATLPILSLPAREADRCRLADYFQKLVRGDDATVAWVRAFAAADVVQRAVIAASQGIALIDLAFMEETPLGQTPLFQAGAGNNGWAGMAKTTVNFGGQERTVGERYPSFRAIRQLAGHLRGASRIERVDVGEPQSRVYRIQREDDARFIAWLQPEKLLLPGDPVPEETIAFSVGGSEATIESLITEISREQAERKSASLADGKLQLTLTPTPVFVVPGG